MDPVLYPYEVVGADALIRHDHKDYREGDKLELTRDAALRNRWLLKPLSEEGAFDQEISASDATLRTMRGHEQLELLEAEKAELEKKLARVEERIAAANKTVEEEKARRKPAPGPDAANRDATGERPAPVSDRPAPAVQQAEVTQGTSAKK